MRRRRARRLLAGVIAATLAGALLALIPTPSFSVQRGMRVDNDIPPLALYTAAKDTLLAQRSKVSEFRMIGASWTGAVNPDVSVRTSHNGVWSAWQSLGPADYGPDPGSRESHPGPIVSEPLWIGRGDGYQVRTPTGLTGLQVHLVRETGPQLHITATQPTAHAAAPMPPINTRASWGARPPVTNPEYAPTVQMAFIHHTVGSNDYAPGDVPAILRGIQSYHMDTNGWNDIGYNFLIDRFGGIWEGRAGGMDQPVIGAQVLGFNSGSTGVALLGDFTNGPAPGVMIDAAGRLLAWKLSLTNVDPMGVNNFQSQDSSSGAKYPAGTVVTLNNISGHQDANYTDCPGQVEGQLPQIRSTAKGWSGAFLAFPSGFRGGAYVAAADFTGDWISEVVTGAGAGGGPAVGVWRDTGVQLGGFYAFPLGFLGGVRVGTGLLEPNGPRDVIAAAGPGGGPAVEVFHADGTNVRGWYAYDPRFAGGVYVAAGNVDPASPGDEVVTGAGEGGGPHVRIFSNTGAPLGGFMAYPTAFIGGVRVAVGDVFGDGSEEIVTGAGPGGGPQVNVFRMNGQLVGSFMAYDPGFRGGVYVGTVKSPDGKSDWIVTGAGEGGGTQARVFDYHGDVGGNGFFYGPPSDTTGVRIAGGAFISQVPGQAVVTEGPGSLPLVGFRRLDGPAFFPTQ
ncbi:MAG: peptidoglycan recognition protein [Acidimicrobiia bacterium]|nr:peptidoglycan recognition protein [Acidimicrobiia bacterium]